MKHLLIAVAATCATLTGATAASSDAVTQADLQALIQRLNKLEAENKAQAKRIAQLEGEKAQAGKPCAKSAAARPHDAGTTVSESGKVYTTASGSSYYLADATAGIFEPLSASGIKITPYGTLELDAVYNSRGTVGDFSTDWVADKTTAKRQGHNTSLAMQNSIFGVKLETPETWNGWKIGGKVEFDIFGKGDENDYGFHWRHAYMEAVHEDSGWSILAGQTWHLWKIVTPSEIDGAWMEHTGHPYRRSPQFRLTKNFKGEKDNLEVRVGIVKGGPGMGGDRDNDEMQDNSASAWALIEGALVYSREASWAKGQEWLVGIGGMYGRDRSHRWTRYDEVEDRNYYDGQADEYDSKMLLVGASLPIFSGLFNDSADDFDKLVLTGQFFAGDNLQGVQAGAGNSVAYHTPGARGKTVQTMGGFLDLNYKLNYNWAFAVGYGFDNPDDDDVGKDAAGNGTGITYNDRAYITAFYQVNDNLHFALEYARLSTDYYNDGTSPDQRVQFTTYFEF